MNAALPGNDLIEAGVLDLRAGRETIAALLVAIGSPRLCRLGLEIPMGFSLKAQGCEERATLGKCNCKFRNANGVMAVRLRTFVKIKAKCLAGRVMLTATTSHQTCS